ncbi:MAG TPA: hypothetical protein VJG83_05460 [archaeon]|nr:hypothetical protein [archaeon]
MVSLIKNIIYLGPSGALSLAGFGCLWLLYLSNVFYLQILFLIAAIVLFYIAFTVAKYGFDTLEQISKIDAQSKIEVEKEKTNRLASGHVSKMEQIRAKKIFEEEKIKRDVGVKLIKRILE